MSVSSPRDGCGRCDEAGRPDSHTEVRATHRRDGLRWSAQVDLRRGLAPEEMKEKFTRRTAEPRRR